jgi:dihydrofolate synthase/folylpolyglutamate synthase
VDDYFPEIPLILVFGVSEDKQLMDMLEAILPRTDYFIATQSDHPRAMDADSLEMMANDYDCTTESTPDVTQALQKALSLAGNDKLVVVAGSIFVAASARIAWFEMKKGNQQD